MFVVHTKELISTFRILAGRPERKRHLRYIVRDGIAGGQASMKQASWGNVLGS
jgi:hypothetical protein